MKIIADSDPEVDAAMAILLALYTEADPFLHDAR
jgi:inosine-uridine nucleoside N-ribohydrolase